MTQEQFSPSSNEEFKNNVESWKQIFTFKSDSEEYYRKIWYFLIMLNPYVCFVRTSWVQAKRKTLEEHNNAKNILESFKLFFSFQLQKISKFEWKSKDNWRNDIFCSWASNSNKNFKIKKFKIMIKGNLLKKQNLWILMN